MNDPSILVVVPKRDELKASARVFGIDVDHPSVHVDGRVPAWNIVIGGQHVRIICPNLQGADKLAIATLQELRDGGYSAAFCIGTAAGRASKVRYLDVVLCTRVLDLQEWRATGGALEPQWTDAPKPIDAALQDVDDFVKDAHWRPGCRAQFVDLVDRPTDSSLTDVYLEWPRALDGWLATTGFLHNDEALLLQVWNIHSRLRAADMESAGFVNACDSLPRRIPWFVVRAVSDYGTAESKIDALRPAAGTAAAAVAKSFIQSGMKQSHPLYQTARASDESALSSTNFFSNLSMPEYLSRELQQRFELKLDRHTVAAGTTVTDLSYSVGANVAREELIVALDEIRENYYTEKYSQYEDQADARSVTGRAWLSDVKMGFEYLNANLEESDVLYVGVGKGRDLYDLFPSVKSLVGIDLSQQMLNVAKQQYPQMTVSRDSAERLATVPDDSIDLYFSLRTFQSSLFDLPEAVRQASRVLRAGGAMLVSIPGGFLDIDEGGSQRWVPGLLIPGTKTVDRTMPRRIADQLQTELERLMFERIGFHQRADDLYVYATKRR